MTRVKAPCKVSGCDKPTRRNQLCNFHSTRARIGISLDAPLMRVVNVSVDDRWSLGANGCWEWTGPRDQKGYGRQGAVRAHRAMYELHIGPIPDGLAIDHLCRNRGCVNPAHLEPVTTGENNRRAALALDNHCRRGHEFTPENTAIVTSNGRRTCRQCVRAARAASEIRRKSAAKEATP